MDGVDEAGDEVAREGMEGELQKSSEDNDISTELKTLREKTTLATTVREARPSTGYSDYRHSPVKTIRNEELCRTMAKPQVPEYDPISPPPPPNLDDYPPLSSIWEGSQSQH